jgi:hypothetical protein
MRNFISCTPQQIQSVQFKAQPNFTIFNIHKTVWYQQLQCILKLDVPILNPSINLFQYAVCYLMKCVMTDVCNCIFNVCFQFLYAVRITVTHTHPLRWLFSITQMICWQNNALQPKFFALAWSTHHTQLSYDNWTKMVVCLFCCQVKPVLPIMMMKVVGDLASDQLHLTHGA